MMRTFTWGFIAALVVAAGGSAQAGVLSTTRLTVNLRDDNGAIDGAVFDTSLGAPGDSEFFDSGFFVSDYGFQASEADTASFRLYDTNGSEGLSVPDVPGGTSFSGGYSQGVASISFSRVYSLVAGLNVLRVTTTITNLGGALADFGFFDSFDPDQGTDQGSGSSTINDVISLAGGTQNAAQAISLNGVTPYTVIAGSVDSRSTVSFLGTLGVFDGTDLNSAFAGPVDPNGATADIGFMIGLRTALGVGASTSFTYDLAFGLNATEAQDQFLRANLAGPDVPEPSSMALLGLGAIGAWGAARRRRNADQNAA